MPFLPLRSLNLCRRPVRGTAVCFVLLGVVTAVACGPETPPESGLDTPASTAAATTAPFGSSESDLAQLVGTAPPAQGVVVSIVLFDPYVEVDVPLPEEVPVMDQYGRAFNPEFLLMRRGQTVRFTNSEDDVHTVHVKDSAGESLFNVATLFGSRYEFTFDREDSYDVICNTHTEMFANILVVDSPYAVIADRDGAFAVPDMVPGTYTATVLIGGDSHEREIEVVPGRNEIDLTGL